MNQDIPTTHGGIEITGNPDIQLNSLSRKTIISAPQPQDESTSPTSDLVAHNGAAKTMNIYNRKIKRQKRTEIAQLTVLFWSAFLAGWNDASTGPLLPRIREVYHVTSMLESNLSKADYLSLR